MDTADISARIKKQPIGVVCGLICLLSIGWLYYRNGETERRQAEYEAKSAEAKKVLSNVSISKGLPAEVAELQAATKEMEGRLIRDSQLAVNLQYFYKLEAETEVKLLDVRQNPRNRNAKSAYVGIPFNVNVQGSYKNVMAFLQRVEKGRHFCRLLAVTMNKSPYGAEGQASSPGITMALNLELLGQP
jgi:Tfp pilus assembly protein PilO